MPAITVHRPRHVLVVVPSRGEELRAATAEALAGRAVGHAWIVGRGSFDEVEIEDAGARRTFVTPTRIVSLDGRATAGGGTGVLSISATVARKTPQGMELLSGQLVRAIVHDVELMITPLDPVAADAEAGTTSEAERETEAEADAEAPARTPKPPDPWAAVAKASAAAPKTDGRARVVPPPPPALAPPAAPPTPPRRKSIEAEVYPEPGDLLDHFAFGRCVVLRSDGDELLVQHPASGRTRTIRLSALQASPPIDEDGKRLFKLTQRRST